MIKHTKNKTFKNSKLCRKFIDNLTMRFKRRFKHTYSLWFVINDKCTQLRYWQVIIDKPLNRYNYDYIYNQKMWNNSRFIDLY